ncbi:MAG: UDP-N-acetylglucosamine 1-carboxyvinyltransferase [Eubacteriales bacterium]|nr:UDP-N-acetylglucosamine 1-carboxyvinyltransferase [Eubacteriales bacterium]
MSLGGGVDWLESYHITGGKILEGDHTLNGAKNAVLPILAATIVSGRTSRIENCPNLSDVRTMGAILKEMGCKVLWEGDTISVDSSSVDTFVIPQHLMKEIRSSVFLMGPTLARCGQVNLSNPGGCAIGRRPIDIHLSALKRLGVEIHERDGYLECKTKGLVGNIIPLEFPSVGATENTMMAALMAEGETRILNGAKEPEIIDLQNYLRSCGADISGAGTDEIRIVGKNPLFETTYQVIPDRIEGGTILAAVAATGGQVVLKNAIPDHMEATLKILEEAGCNVIREPNRISLKAPNRLKGVKHVVTQPYPGFPTDMQSQVIALLVRSDGSSRITETIFENRFKYVEELNKMGAKIRLEGRTATVTGVNHLKGTRVSAQDLRGGASLVIAGLVAEGDTVVDQVYHIDRGYERLETVLSKLGAEITRRTSQII